MRAAQPHTEKAKLTLQEVVKELPFKTHQVNLFWRVYSIIENNLNIDFDVYLPTKGLNLQRRFCWNLEQKQQLILSVIKGIYIPKLAILVNAQHKDNIYQIIDGKQRLSALLDFITGNFAIPVNGELYTIDDMDNRLRHKLLSYSPVCEVAYFYNDEPISDDAKIQWFQQINFSGTPQDEQHLLNILNSTK